MRGWRHVRPEPPRAVGSDREGQRDIRLDRPITRRPRFRRAPRLQLGRSRAVRARIQPCSLLGRRGGRTVVTREGPLLETLTRRLTETPPEFLADTTETLAVV